MKTFYHLHFKSREYLGGTQARMFFRNGYGVSVITGAGAYSDDNTYELAVLKGNAKDSELTYDTPITSDVLGWQSPEDITNAMAQVQALS